MSKHIFISFDDDNDRNYRYLLSALTANNRSAIDFIEVTPSEIESCDVGRIKAVLTAKIRLATHTLVIVGAQTNNFHRDWALIGERNWQCWEIQQSKREGKKLIAVKIHSTNPTPAPLLSAGASWAFSYTEAAILNAINAA